MTPEEIPWPAALVLAALFWTVFAVMETRARRQAERVEDKEKGVSR